MPLMPSSLADRVGEAGLATGRAGRPDCGSPQITIRLRMPKRVRNIFICGGVVFCASSRMMKASLSVRPRMKAIGAISISPAGDAPLDLLGRQHVVERVVERAEIGIDLLLHVAGKEAEALARLDRGARQDQPVDAAADQLRHRLRDREIGLAGAGRAEREDHLVAGERFHVGGLHLRARDDRLLAGADHHLRRPRSPRRG